ncbi:hypothetical protein [Streptomyces sp. NPDC001675]
MDIYYVIRAERADHARREALRRIGDALADPDPVQGQGMTAIAMQAQVLHECLRAHPDAYSLPYLTRTAELTDRPWEVGVPVHTRRPLAPQQMRAESIKRAQSMSRAYQEAVQDADTGRAVLRHRNLLDGPRVPWEVYADA